MWICEEKSFFRRKFAYFSVFLPKSPADRAIFPGKTARNSGFPISPIIFPRLWKTSLENRQFSQYAAADTVRAGKKPFSENGFPLSRREGKFLWIPFRKRLKKHRKPKYDQIFAKSAVFIGFYTHFHPQRKTVSKISPQKFPKQKNAKFLTKTEKTPISVRNLMSKAKKQTFFRQKTAFPQSQHPLLLLLLKTYIINNVYSLSF